jgi:hypothetical protein
MLAEIVVKEVKRKDKEGNIYYERRPKSTIKKVAIKNADGSVATNAEGEILYDYKDTQRRPKEPKWVKNVVKEPTKTKRKLRVTPAQWERMELEQKSRKLREECGLKRQILDAEYDALYKKYPAIKPKEKQKAKKVDEGAVPCSSSAFSACKSVIYRYPSGNQKIVITEKLPVVKKVKVVKEAKQKKYKWKQSKGVADCGCSQRTD